MGITRVDQTFVIAGKTWTLAGVGPRVIEGFRAWIREQAGDQAGAETARQLQYFSIVSPLAQGHLETEAGLVKLFQLRLLQHHPEATGEDAVRVMQALADIPTEASR